MKTVQLKQTLVPESGIPFALRFMEKAENFIQHSESFGDTNTYIGATGTSGGDYTSD